MTPSSSSSGNHNYNLPTTTSSSRRPAQSHSLGAARAYPSDTRSSQHSRARAQISLPPTALTAMPTDTSPTGFHSFRRHPRQHLTMPFSASCESFVPHHTPCLIDTAIPLSPLSSSFASTGFISEATATPTSDGMPQTPDAKCDAKLKTYFLQRLHNREKLASVLDSIFSLDANLDSSKGVSSSADSDNAATVRIASKTSATKNSLLIRRETNVTLAPLHNRSPQLRSSTVSSSSSCDTLVPTARPYSHHTTHRPFSTSPAVPSSLRTPLTALDFVPSESSSPSPPVSGDCFSFGLSMFNIKPSVGIEQWQSDGLLPSPASPSDIARLLFSYSNVPSIDKRQLGLYLGSGEVLNREILREFTHLFDFAGMDFVPALRHYLRYFRMPGEAQAIDRFMLEFSKRYVETNPRALASPDAAYVLAYSVILLNTDLHSPMVKQRMTKQEFVNNTTRIKGCEQQPKDLLETIYDDIASNEISPPDSPSGGACIGARVRDTRTPIPASPSRISPLPDRRHALHRVAKHPRGFLSVHDDSLTRAAAPKKPEKQSDKRFGISHRSLAKRVRSFLRLES